MDGATLAEVMRQRGINMRYLGKVLDLVLRSPARGQLDHIYVSDARVAGAATRAGGRMEARGPTETPLSEPLQKIGIGELITRSAKHIFKTYLQVLPSPLRRGAGGGAPRWGPRALLMGAPNSLTGSGALGPFGRHQPLSELLPELLPQPRGPPAC